MIPAICRSVVVLGISRNGALEHPAVITRSWGGDRDTKDGPICVNLTVFPDCSAPMPQGSVMLFDTRDAALAHRVENPGVIVAHWPEQVRG